ncbi:lysophospholipid acyltransferase family protein [Thiorhodospira sibirica]|uniref:lysophospholipid acyltransferase family protein n=1 Tax=Thiorhodospira sibirica TaxID=154347 RepID=UPI00022C0B3D|nr:lysophospholipid acyltransferase family protein [Thiorhodospira sibirica]
MYRLFGLTGHCVLGMVLTLLWGRYQPNGLPTARFAQITRWWLQRAGRIVGLRVSVTGQAQAGALLTANHISWLDILVLGGHAPLSFLSKAEVGRWPVIGWLARRAGTLFIQRGAQHTTAMATQHIVQRLRHGGAVAIFPEATTSDGRSVRHFHPRLFAAAQEAPAVIQPVALSYPALANGQPSPAPFIDDDQFFPHVWRVLGAALIPVRVEFLPPLAVDGQPRRELAEMAQTRVASALAKCIAGSSA